MEKTRIIFEAFQQADAGTSRKYGGTGLGPRSSRELATCSGARSSCVSVPGKGSTFTLTCPRLRPAPTAAVASAPDAETKQMRGANFPAVRVWDRPVESIPDDRKSLRDGAPLLLIVEDDPHYARILVDLARAQGFQVLVAIRGSEALALAREYRPTAVSLDVFLPDMLGWTVLNQLKQDPATRHIPVQIVTLDEDRQRGLARGAFSFLPKPTSPEGLEAALGRIREFSTPAQAALVVEENEAEQLSISACGPRRASTRRGAAASTAGAPDRA